MNKKNGKKQEKVQRVGEYKLTGNEDQDKHQNAFYATIKELEERYEYVINNISEVIFQTDKEGYLTFLNSVWDKVTGFSFEESIGTDIFELIHKDDLDEFRKQFNELINNKISILSIEVKLLKHNKNYIWTHIQLQRTCSSGGVLLGTTGTLTDIDLSKKNFYELQYRLMFERIIMDISTELMNFEAAELESKINNSLKLLCEITGFDAIHISLFSGDFSCIEKTFLWKLDPGKSEITSEGLNSE